MEHNNTLLKKVLIDTFGRKFSFLTSRGTSALYAALRTVTKPGDEVILPAMVCPAVLYAVLYARLKPVLCDICADDYTIDLTSLRQCISDRTSAIIAVHLFGHACRIDEICEVARKRDIPVIEDIAQSVGTTYKRKPTGTFGDITILSFGEHKIIDGGGGGAVLTDETRVADQLQTYSHFPERPVALESICEIYRKIYYAGIELEKYSPEGEHRLLKKLPYVFRNLYLFEAPSLAIDKIVNGFECLQDMKCARRKNASKYQELLKHPAIYHPPMNSSINVYRYSVLIARRSLRDKIVDGLRSNGFHASTLYPSVHSFLLSRRPKGLDIAIDAGERILNLWVEPGLPQGYVESCSSLVLRIIKDNL